MANNLFTPLKAGGLELANRIVMAPLTRGRAGLSRVPNTFMRQYYEARASAGLIITEATAVSAQGYGWYGAPGLYTEEHAEAWKSIVDAVHAKGGKIVHQMWHMGRQSHPSFHPVTNEIVAPSAIAIPDGHVHDQNNIKVPAAIPRALRLDEIPGIIEQFRYSAELAKKAGFDGVEVHGANGYLLDEFMQSVTNHRTDAYGGSYENRFRIVKEIIEAVATVYPYDRIGIRISPNGIYGGMGSEDNIEMFSYVARELSKYGLAYLHIMDGVGFGYHQKCRPMTIYDVKKEFHGVVIGNVGYTKETAEGAIRTGAADAIAFGRPFISNPDLVERFKNDWPLNPPSSYTTWYGTTPNAADSLEGYLGFPTYEAK